MKARIKKGPNAGREIEVYKFDDWCYRNSKSGKIYQKEELDFSENTTDWATFRREAAKDILCSMVRGGYDWGRRAEQAKLAVLYAEELIKALQKEKA